jgi:hypothetical protein
MSRSGYSEDFDDNWKVIMYRGAVVSAIRGRRGQAFLREMLRVLDEMPEKKLIDHELEKDGGVCALGAVGKARGLNMEELDPGDRGSVAKSFGISKALAAEIAYENDEAVGYWANEKPEERFTRIHSWVKSHIKTEGETTK